MGFGFEPQQRRCVVASNKYLINCLVLVQADFEINVVLNGFIIVRVRCGGWGEGLPLNGVFFVILGSHFFFGGGGSCLVHS